MSVDLPTFGKPSRPASASTRSSRRSSRCSPGVPGSACRGARLRRRREVHVAAAAAAAARDDGLARRAREVGEQLARLVVVDERAGRDAQHQVVAARAVLLLAAAVLAAPGAQALRIGEVEQRRRARVDAQDDVAAVAAVAAARAAARDVLLAPERDAAVGRRRRPRRGSRTSSTNFMDASMVAQGSARLHGERRAGLGVGRARLRESIVQRCGGGGPAGPASARADASTSGESSWKSASDARRTGLAWHRRCSDDAAMLVRRVRGFSFIELAGGVRPDRDPGGSRHQPLCGPPLARPRQRGGRRPCAMRPPPRRRTSRATASMRAIARSSTGACARRRRRPHHGGGQQRRSQHLLPRRG